MDNKFGKCCGCPPLMNDSRNFTRWEPHHNYHMELKNFIKAKNDSEFKKLIIDKPELVDDFNNINTLNCFSEKIKFNIDSSDYHKMFNEEQLKDINETQTVLAYEGKELSSR